jgi:hypothetical protein
MQSGAWPCTKASHGCSIRCYTACWLYASTRPCTKVSHGCSSILHNQASVGLQASRAIRCMHHTCQWTHNTCYCVLCDLQVRILCVLQLSEAVGPTTLPLWRRLCILSVISCRDYAPRSVMAVACSLAVAWCARRWRKPVFTVHTELRTHNLCTHCSCQGAPALRVQGLLYW